MGGRGGTKEEQRRYEDAENSWSSLGENREILGRRFSDLPVKFYKVVSVIKEEVTVIFLTQP